MTTLQIGANRERATRTALTFIHINTSSSLRFETVDTEALAVQAFSVVDAVVVTFAVSCHVNLKQFKRIQL